LRTSFPCPSVVSAVAESILASPEFGPSGAVFTVFLYLFHGGQTVPRSIPNKDERKWPRLYLAIPVFVRTLDGNGKDSLEFATAINISPGGALVAVRRSLPKSTLVSLEIPSAPIGPAGHLKATSRIMQAKAVWVAHLDDYHLLGLKFTRPLSVGETVAPGKRVRKASSTV
jgi:hypothetical protein